MVVVVQGIYDNQFLTIEKNITDAIFSVRKYKQLHKISLTDKENTAQESNHEGVVDS